MTPIEKTIAVIDPAARVAETGCFNQMARQSSMPLTYHLPAMFGFSSLSIYNDTDPAGVVIFGSGASVYDENPWQRPFEAWLSPLLERGVPCLGICYGHQMLAHMFGGRIDFLSKDREKLIGFRDVAIDSVANIWQKQTGPLVVSHREHVVALPPEFEIIAKSPQCPIDGFRHRSLPIIGLQPHPEATCDFMANQDIPFDANTANFDFGNSLVAYFLRFAAER